MFKKSFSLFLISLLCCGCNLMRVHHLERNSGRDHCAQEFFRYLDHTIDTVGVNDRANFSLPGFPYLRANRFLAAIENLDSTAVELMRQLDLADRGKEIRNLPESVAIQLAAELGLPNRDAILEKAAHFSEELLKNDQAVPGFYTALRKSLKNDRSEYRFGQRVIGLYPLFAVPTALSTLAAQKEFKKWHQAPLENLKKLGTIKTYGPNNDTAVAFDRISAIFNRAQRNSLGTFDLAQDEIKQLVLYFAPVLSQDTVADYDRFGEVFWKNNRVEINPAKPTVYYYVTYALINGEPALQLNYVVWYKARAGKNAPWLERGRLDGLTVRVSLDRNGSPVIMDIMNNCGCYHFFVPDQTRMVKIIPQKLGMDAFVPAYLPKISDGERYKLRVNSGWHQVEHVDRNKADEDKTSYELLAYDLLESLPKNHGEFESVFNAYGIMKTSSRIEPIFFFPSGIRSIGLMRQRSHHAIKMVGQSHFDDPHLFDKNFIFK